MGQLWDGAGGAGRTDGQWVIGVYGAVHHLDVRVVAGEHLDVGGLLAQCDHLRSSAVTCITLHKTE